MLPSMGCRGFVYRASLKGSNKVILKALRITVCGRGFAMQQ
jgi:hypothetical protein